MLTINNNKNKEKVLFKEIQKFRQIWVWTIIILSCGSIIGILIYQLLTGEKVGTRPAPNIFLFLFILFFELPLLLGFYFAKLTTIIDENGIHYGFNMLTSKLNFLPWTKIKGCKITQYKFVGFGYRITSSYGIVYNVNGNKGLFIEKSNGDKLMIGTNRPEELEKIVTNLKHRT